jgi:hypothetical protein
LKSSGAKLVSCSVVLVVLFSQSIDGANPQAGGVQNPILFVTQVPLPADFATVTSTFANQIPTPSAAPRGGDLWIRYPDGTLKNLTRAAGFGMQGSQGSGAIAVREPSVHWSGTKALFSMVIGAPDAQFQQADYFWQMYEVTGLGEAETPVITKAANQPAAFNNVAPIYGTDDRIIFASDRPRNGARYLYPQLDEYEEAPTVTGLWSLDPVSGDLRMLNHTPSGASSRRRSTASGVWCLPGGIICSAISRPTTTSWSRGATGRSTMRTRARAPRGSISASRSFPSRAALGRTCWPERTSRGTASITSFRGR